MIPGSFSPGRAGRVALGALVLGLSLTPVYRLLDHPGTGLFGGGTVTQAQSNLAAAWLGIGIALGMGAVLAILLPPEPLLRALHRVGRVALRVPLGAWTAGLALLSGGLALWASRDLFLGMPTLVDEMTSLLHARFLAAGQEAGALGEPSAAWLVPNGVLTDRGWVSQYPPAHVLLLALGLRVGAPWLVGPLLTALLAASTSLVVHHLLGRDDGGARLGSALVAASPFVVFLGSGYLSHVSAAAFASLTLLGALRAREGGWGWSVAAGAAMGVLVGSRPWVGIFLGSAFTLGLWLVASREPGRGPRWLAARLGGATLGGAPFAVALGAYNARFFGHPLRLGYTAAFGETHDLGFHIDPWGNVYGPGEAVGYVAANLLALGFHALETSLPLVPFVAAYLVLVPRLPRGAGVLLAWALLPLAANVFYWHHGFHLGPRMLYEAAPGWLLLAAMAFVGLVRAAPAHRLPGRRPPSLRHVALWGVLASVPGVVYGLPLRVSSYRWTSDTLQRIQPPPVPGSERALVFVHGTWSERIAARLQAAGFGLDSLETGLRRNDVCTFHRWTAQRLTGSTGDAAPPPAADFESLPGFPERFEPVLLSPGNQVHVDRRAPWTPECQREAAADRGGVISLAPLVWQGDLPGIEQGRPMFVRDLGPAANRQLMQAHPDRRAYVFLALPPEGTPTLLPYERGEPMIWGKQ